MRYTVSGDIKLAFVIDVEADSEEEAEDIVNAMRYRELNQKASVDTSTHGVVIDGVEKH